MSSAILVAAMTEPVDALTIVVLFLMNGEESKTTIPYAPHKTEPASTEM